MSILIAEKGKILTNGIVYGRRIHLAEGINESDFYSITEEEYALFKSMSEEGGQITSESVE